MNTSSISAPDNILVQFKLIHNFISELHNNYGTTNRGLALYHRLLSKTTISHTDVVIKHCNVFKNFCDNNCDALFERDLDKIKEKMITYSENVKFNVYDIINKSDQKDLIWDHLLTIYAVIDPLSKAKQILKERKASNNQAKETNFLSDIVEKIEGTIDPNSNPMEAIGSVLQSGVFNDLVTQMGSSLKDGSLDLSSLMGSVQEMMGGKDGAPPNLNGMLNMLDKNNGTSGTNGGDIPALSNAINMLNTNEDGAPPNLAGMMNMLGNLSNGNSKPELPPPLPVPPKTDNKKEN